MADAFDSDAFSTDAFDTDAFDFGTGGGPSNVGGEGPFTDEYQWRMYRLKKRRMARNKKLIRGRRR